MEDAQEGATLGPFFDIDEVSEEIRTGSRPTIRGRAEAQRSRGRQCHLQWDQHMATVVTEKLQLPSTDTNVAAIKWLRSRLPDAPLRGWVLDERRAYWQIPTAPSHRKWSVVASSVFNFVMVGHSFGLVSGVYNYNRRSTAITGMSSAGCSSSRLSTSTTTSTGSSPRSRRRGRSPCPRGSTGGYRSSI